MKNETQMHSAQPGADQFEKLSQIVQRTYNTKDISQDRRKLFMELLKNKDTDINDA
jgi:hypothetical protein